MNVQTGLTWKTFIVALNYPCLMHPHLRFSNFPHKSTYTCHYVYMYFEMLLARRQHCVHFEGMKVQQRWKNVCHGNIYSNLKHCSAKDTNFKKRIWCCYYSHFHAYSPLVSCPRPNFNTKDIIWFKCFKAECYISEFIKNVLAW